ncbi:MAG: penicillin-binding transpeptidase domain-containing protein, partial [Patescibacteria group bacterium]
VTDVLQDLDNQPFLNRAIGGVYPPGSTFKIVVAAAGLASNVIDTNYSIKDTGIIRINEFSFANWFYTDHGGTDGEVNVIKGLKRSNDIFFYKLAEKIGVDRLSSVSEKFGLGKILGIDLDGEQSGLVPTREWKQKVIGEPWYLGDTYHYGIGQGYLLTTPLQVNVWTQSVANNGKIYRPHILKDIGDEVLAKNIFDSKTTNPVRQGMIEACQTGGVAYPLFEFKVKNSKLKVNNRDILKVATGSADLRQIVVACKTGTAQHGGEQTKPHAWITLFAPANNPQIVLTVLAEESGEGSGVAAPIAKEILTEWFSRQIKN